MKKLDIKSLIVRVTLSFLFIIVLTTVANIGSSVVVRNIIKNMAEKELAVETDLAIYPIKEHLEMDDEDTFEYIQSYVKKTKLNHDAYLLILDNKGVIRNHPNDKLIGNSKVIKDLGIWEQMKGSDGLISYEYNGDSKIAYYERINKDTLVLSTILMKELYSSMKIVDIIFIITNILTIAVLVVVGVYLRNEIRYIINGMMEFTKNLSQKQLLSMLNFGHTSEGIFLADELQKSMHILRKSLRHVQDNAKTSRDKTLDNYGDMVKGSESMNEIIVAIDEIAVGNMNQAENLESITAMCNNLNISISEMADIFIPTKKASDEVYLKVDKTNTIISDVQTLMDVSLQSVESIESQTVELRESSKSLNNIVDVISNISSQINLLALNASIEAARSGDAGKGFSVIANEISVLSKNSEESVDNIAKVIKEILSQLDKLTLAVEEISKASSGQNDAYSNMTENIDTLFELLEVVTKNIKLINDNVIESRNSTQVLNGNIMEASTVSEEVASMTEEITSSAQSFGTVLVNLLADAKVNTDLSSEINHLLSEYYLGNEKMDLNELASILTKMEDKHPVKEDVGDERKRI